MPAIKDPSGYNGHIKSLKNSLTKDDYRTVLCQASMAYAKHHFLYPGDPRISIFIQLFQTDIDKVGDNNLYSDYEFKTLRSNKSLTTMTTDGIKKLKQIKPLNLNRIEQQLYSAEDASKLLKYAITSFTEQVFYYNRDVHSGVTTGPAPTLALKAAAGIGKTIGIINQCIGSSAIQGSIDYYVPSDVLGNQIIDDLKSHLLGIGDSTNQSPLFDPTITFRAIRGRNKFDEQGNPLCLDTPNVDKASALGISIQKNVCLTCDHFTDCGYQRQFNYVELPKFDHRDNPDIAPVVNVLAHNYLFLHTPLYDKEQSSTRFSQNYCNLAIVDEKFWDKGIKTDEIKVAAIHNLKSEIASFVVTQLKAKRPLIKLLLDKYSLDEVSRAAAALSPTLTDMTKPSGTTKSKRVADMLYTLKEEMLKFKLNHTDSRCVSWGINKAGDELLYLSKRKSLTVPDDVPMIFIDADLSLEILKLYRSNIKLVDIPAKRLATVYQVTDITNSKSTLLENDIPTQRAQSVASFIEHLATTGKTLAVTIKDLRTALTGETNEKLPKCGNYRGAQIAHFGSLRGLNDFDKYDNIVIVGRMEPNVNTLERQASSLWWDADQPITTATPNDKGQFFFEKLPKAIQHKGHSPHVIRTSCHPDPRAQVLLEQIREAETTQAIDRLRLVHKPKGPRSPRVFILSNIPVDIEVDQLFRWEQYQLIQQLVDESDGFIPLNKTDLVSHVISIRTTSVAANRIKKIKDNWDWYQSTGMLKGWSQFKYRKIGGTKWSRVICCIPEDDLIKKIGLILDTRVEVITDEL